MKENSPEKKLEAGQVIPLVVLMLFAIIAMVALILDGGSILSNRRTAQAAADASALAGAQVYCGTKNETTTRTTVLEYLQKNGASLIDPINDLKFSSGQVDVTATVVQNSTFFAGIYKFFGQNVDNLNAKASAAAGCYAVSGKSVVPLAWNCRARTVGDEGTFDPQYGCQIQTLSWKLIGPMADSNWEPVTERKSSVAIPNFDGNTKDYFMSSKYPTSIVDSLGIPPEQIYIIMDTDKTCIEVEPLSDSAIKCDLNGDGKLDIQTGGNRGWLYLTSSTSNIANWIGDNGPHPDFSLKSHIWLSGKSGDDVNVFNKMIGTGFMGQVVLIPVYNDVPCQGSPISQDCLDRVHASPWPNGTDTFDIKSGNHSNYHILNFEPFYVTCIDKKGDCPGFNWATTFPKNAGMKDIPVIEGFFLTDVDVSPDITQDCSLNMGNCTISLSK